MFIYSVKYLNIAYQDPTIGNESGFEFSDSLP